MRYFAGFFFRFGLLNGSGGSELFGAERIVLTAFRNLFMASGHSVHLCVLVQREMEKRRSPLV